MNHILTIHRPSERSASVLTNAYLSYAMMEVFNSGDIEQAQRWHEMAERFHHM